MKTYLIVNNNNEYLSSNNMVKSQYWDGHTNRDAIRHNLLTGYIHLYFIKFMLYLENIKMDLKLEARK